MKTSSAKSVWGGRPRPRRVSRPARASRRGGALLAVLWLCAGLSAIAFAVANSVRGETERAATNIESVRAYYLAAGAVERAALWLQWGPVYRNPDGSPRYYDSAAPRMTMQFPGGEALVEVIPESSKFNINLTKPEELLSLLLALGAAPDRAQEITAAIVDWRTHIAVGALGPFDQFYMAQPSSFRARHASFREIEELLFVKGMTPDIYYGSYGRDSKGNLFPRGALKDCVSVYGSTTGFDINTVEPPVLAAIGFSPEFISYVTELRRQMPIRRPAFDGLTQAGGPLMQRLGVEGYPKTFTIRATARIRAQDGHWLDVRRSASALVRMNTMKDDTTPLRVLRWRDHEWTGAWGAQ